MEHKIPWLTILRIVCVILIFIALLNTIYGIYFYYFNQPELIGLNYLPVDYFSSEMIDIYWIIIVSSFQVFSCLGILSNRKWGWFLLAISYTYLFVLNLIDLFRYLFKVLNIYNPIVFSVEFFIPLAILLLINTKVVRSHFDISFNLFGFLK